MSERPPQAPSPLRVCLLIEGFLPEIEGGMFVHAHELASGLIARGVEVTVVTRRLRPGFPARDVVDGVPVVRLGPPGVLKGRGWRAGPPLARFLAELTAWLLRHGGRFDALLVIGVKTLLPPALLARALGGPPIVVRSESPVEFNEAVSRESLARIRPRALGRALLALAGSQRGFLRRVDACVAISPELEALFRAAGVPPARIAAIPNGVDTERFSPPADRAAEVPALRARLGLPADGRPILLYTGRLARAKGLLGLAAAFRDGPARHPSRPVLVLLGPAEGSHDGCEPELRRIVAADPVLAAGALLMPGAAADPLPWLRAADLFVFPSEYEGFGLSLVEAMAAGLPPVTTPVGVAPEVVDEGVNGHLVPVGDGAAMADRLARLLDAPERWRPMGRAAREAVAARYGMGGVLARYVDLLGGTARGYRR